MSAILIQEFQDSIGRVVHTSKREIPVENIELIEWDKNSGMMIVYLRDGRIMRGSQRIKIEQ